MKVSFCVPVKLGMMIFGLFCVRQWQNNNIAVQSCEEMEQSVAITQYNHIGLKVSSHCLVDITCNHFSLSVSGPQTICSSQQGPYVNTVCCAEGLHFSASFCGHVLPGAGNF